MIQGLALILTFQLAGEVISRLLGLGLPGPVLGMIGMLALFMLRPDISLRVKPAAQGLLSHMSLFFVPAGVGVIAHSDVLTDYGWAVALALVGSTVLTLAAGAAAFAVVAKLTGSKDE